MTIEPSFEIREARAGDVPALAALHVATFKEAHGHHGAPNYELRETQWRATFARGMNWCCYVAEAPDGQLVGFAKGELHDGGVPGFQIDCSLCSHLFDSPAGELGRCTCVQEY